MTFIRTIVLAAVLGGLATAAQGAEKAVQIPHDGLTLNGTLVTAEDGTLADGVVLITHGTLAHGGMEIVRGLQEGLAEAGHGSLAITLSLGLDARTGMYDCAVPHRHRHTDAVSEIAAWLDWLQAQGAGPVTLLGHSRGGNQTAWFAAEHDHPLVNKVVLVAPQTWEEDREATAYEKRYGTPLAAVLDTARDRVAAGQGETMLEDIGFIYCPGATAAAASVVSYYAPDPRLHTPHLIPRIEKPVLVVAAGNDTVVKGLPEAVAPLAADGTVALTVVEGADHMFLDFNLFELTDAVVAFLEE